MDKSRKKRFEKVRGFDKKQLDLLVVQLRTLNMTIRQRRQIRNQIHERLRQSFRELPTQSNVSSHNQTVSWTTRIERRLSELDNHLLALEKKRFELVETVRQHQARVKGWDILLGKILAEQEVATQKEALFAADDRFLGEVAVKNRSSK